MRQNLFSPFIFLINFGMIAMYSISRFSAMKKTVFCVNSVKMLTRDVYEMRLEGDTSDITAPGQFVEITVPGLFLRRPISVCDWNDGELRLLIKDIGKGTDALKKLSEGQKLDIITGLGNGFATADVAISNTALVGGGIGVAPLYALAKHILKMRNGTLTVILGFRSAADVFYEDEFKALGCNVTVVTEDGSVGEKGFVTDSLKTRSNIAYLCACGPLPMLKAISNLPQVTDGQFSLEARMGCGFGACVGCTVKTASGFKRVCKEGPVFRKAELVWQ